MSPETLLFALEEITPMMIAAVHYKEVNALTSPQVELRKLALLQVPPCHKFESARDADWTRARLDELLPSRALSRGVFARHGSRFETKSQGPNSDSSRHTINVLYILMLLPIHIICLIHCRIHAECA